MHENNNSEKLLNSIIEGIRERKGKEIVSMNLTKLHNAEADYFVICHGDSNTQVEAIAESVMHRTEEDLKEKVWHKEGFENAYWVLLDYLNIVVHVFQKEHRDFYNLEGLWADAELVAHNKEG